MIIVHYVLDSHQRSKSNRRLIVAKKKSSIWQTFSKKKKNRTVPIGRRVISSSSKFVLFIVQNAQDLRLLWLYRSFVLGIERSPRTYFPSIKKSIWLKKKKKKNKKKKNKKTRKGKPGKSVIEFVVGKDASHSKQNYWSTSAWNFVDHASL